MEVQQELVEVEVPQINLQLSIDEMAGAAGSYTLEQVKPVGSLAIKNGLFTIGTETGSGQSKRRSGKSAGGIGKYSEQFELITQRLRRGLELVIVFDSTGSMGPEIQALKANLIQLGNATLRTLPETRIAFITYKDNGDVPEVAYSPLTNNLFSLASFLNQIEPSGGGFDIEEAVGLGLAQATTQYKFRSNALKVIIVFGDAPPRRNDLHAILLLAQQFHSEDSFISTVSVRAGMPIPEFNAIAHYGGGESIVLRPQGMLLQELLLLVFGQANRQEAAHLLGL